MSGAFDLSSTDHLLSTTRAVRRKLDLERPVPDEVLLDCLRLAVQAPTPGSTQVWRWLVVRDPVLKTRLGTLFRSVGAAYLQAKAAALGAAARDPAAVRALASAQYLVDNIERVPVFVIPCLLGRPRGTTARSRCSMAGSSPRSGTSSSRCAPAGSVRP